MASIPPPRPRQLDSPALPKIFKYAGKAQVWVYKRTGGRIGGKWRIGAGFRKPVPTLLLEHRGRKSGTAYTVPLLYITDGADTIIVASQGGLPQHPQWYLNLRANPDSYIQIGRARFPVHAITADAEQRAHLWPRLTEAYADFDTYQAWTDRAGRGAHQPAALIRRQHAFGVDLPFELREDRGARAVGLVGAGHRP